MSFRAIIYAYVLGGITFIPLLLAAAIAWAIYTSVPVIESGAKSSQPDIPNGPQEEDDKEKDARSLTNDAPKPRKAWLTVRRTFEEKPSDGSYVGLMRNFLDSRSKDPKRSRPKDMWYVVLKGSVLYLYEDEAMTECEAAVQVSSYDVVIAPEGLLDGELFTRRNAICLKPREADLGPEMPNVTKQMGLSDDALNDTLGQAGDSDARKEVLLEAQRTKNEARREAFDQSTPWYIFVRSCVDMEDWYLSLIHAANHSSSTSTLEPVAPVFLPSDMQQLVSTLDDQPDVIPMRWLNALIGRLFFSFYRTDALESYIIGRLMKKLSKVKTPSFLQNIKVTEASVGNMPPSFSKPMLKELTKEGDAALEVKISYKGEVRLTVEATAVVSLGQRFRTYNVKLVLAVVLRKLDGNLLVKVKRPPSSRIWYAFTQPPDLVLTVEPVVSERQIKWGMVLGPIESILKEVINDSVVLPNMDDIAFFESSQYQHRGGIWGDAKRKERSLDDMLGPDQASASSTSSSTPKNPAPPTNLQKSESGDAVVQSKAETILQAQDSGDSSDGALASEKLETRSQPSHSRQTSTHSISVPGTGTGIVTAEPQRAPSGIASGFLTVNEERGRSSQSESSSRRARSVPASSTPSPEDSSAIVDTLEPDAGDDSMKLLSTSAPGTSSMQVPNSARTRSLSSNAKLPSPESTDGSEFSSTAPSETSSTRSMNASSFLASLKSKAVDKQALSNTAKEAMKKWSANWNGFKREHMSGFNNTENAPDGDSAHPQSGLSLFSSTRRGNYADIRAAVVGRREKAQPSNTDSGSSTPRKSYDLSDSDLQEGPSTPSRTSSFSRSSSPQMTSPFRNGSIRAAPIPPKVTTDVQTADVSTPTGHESFTQVAPTPAPPVQAVPIKVQPSQGASMTIPGIHASHRNDVMSMGYAPPTPSQSALPEPKRTPTIQSMYRLFKVPGGGNATGTTVEDSGNEEPVVEGIPRTETQVESITSPSLVFPSQSPDPPLEPSQQQQQQPPSPEVKRTPPPLPPRSNKKSTTTTVMASPPPMADSSTDSEKRRSSSSLASEALKLIATQDEVRKAAVDAQRRDSIGVVKDLQMAAVDETPVNVDSDTTTPSQEVNKPARPIPPPLPPRKEHASTT